MEEARGETEGLGRTSDRGSLLRVTIIPFEDIALTAILYITFPLAHLIEPPSGVILIHLIKGQNMLNGAHKDPLL